MASPIIIGGDPNPTLGLTSTSILAGGVLLSLAMIFLWRFQRSDPLLDVLSQGQWWPDMTVQFTRALQK